MIIDTALAKARSFASGTKRILIDGKWDQGSSGRTFASTNPATGEHLAEIQSGQAEDVDRAVAAARRAFEGPWRRTSPADRQRILLRMADIVERNFEELCVIDTLDMGAPVNRFEGMRQRGVGLLRYYAGLCISIHGDTIENSALARHFSYTLKEPVGVVGAIIPWNVPVNGAIWKISVALAAGCTIVLKPSEEASLGPLRLAELMAEADLPAGVLNVVTGFGDPAGAALAAHPCVDKIAFTGSHLTGQKIAHAAVGNLKRVSLELGGKSPDIVFADADLTQAVPGASMAIFGNSGQICSAGSRLFVQESIYDEFVGRVAEYGSELRLGNGIDPQTQLGPLVSRRQLDRVVDYVASGRAEGANTLTGGDRIASGPLAEGYFMPPTVFDGISDTMRVASEEIFGPVVTAVPFADLDEVISRGNASMFGLGAGIWTNNLSTAHTVAQRINAGTVWVNCYQVVDPAIPFGGNKMSGLGREGGREHLADYLTTKSVCIRL